MHAASRHGTPSLTSLPKDGRVSCFGRSSGGRPSSFRLYTAMLIFSESNGSSWAAWPRISFLIPGRGHVKFMLEDINFVI